MIYSGVKTWKLTSNFPNRKSVWHVKGMNIPSKKMSGYKHGGVRNRVFMTSQKAKYGWISHNHVSCESCAVERGFIAQIKQNINILIDRINHISKTSHCGWISHISSYGCSPNCSKYVSHSQGRFWLLKKETGDEGTVSS